MRPRDGAYASGRNRQPPPSRSGPFYLHGSHVTPILFRKVHAPGPAKSDAIVLAGLPDGGGVDQRGHLLDVVDEDAVVQRLVPVVQVLQHDVLVDVRVQVPEAPQEALLLLGDVHDAVGQQPAEA